MGSIKGFIEVIFCILYGNINIYFCISFMVKIVLFDCCEEMFYIYSYVCISSILY